jgi:AcrR family transcriptional regulator
MTPCRDVDRPAKRGQPVVDRVFAVTLQRLAEVGFERLSIPEIADLAGLNKTSVYRRWPTKRDLVRDAVMASMHRVPDPPDTGSVRTDMLELARGAAAFVESPLGTGVMRTLLAGSTPFDDDEATGLLGWDDVGMVKRLVDRGIARGELRADVDVRLLSSTVAGAIFHRVFVERQSLTEAYLEDLVDLVLAGVRSRGSR